MALDREKVPATGEVAIVVGAAGGVGREVCRALVAQGMRVAAADVPDRNLDSLSVSLLREIDAANRRQVENFVDRVDRELGPAGVLVNCAGVWYQEPYDDISDKRWDQVLSANLGSVFTLCSVVVPRMCATGWGRVVNVASMAGEQGATVPCSHYAAAKGGVIAYSKSLAREVAQSGVRVNVVSPGPVATRMLEGRDERAIAEGTLLGRPATPMEVAGAVGYLASPDADFITGEVLRVNGGALL